MTKRTKDLQLVFERGRGYRERYRRRLLVEQSVHGGAVKLSMRLPNSQVMSQEIDLSKSDVHHLVLLLAKALVYWGD